MDNVLEEWRDVVGRTKWQVSNLGKVRERVGESHWEFHPDLFPEDADSYRLMTMPEDNLDSVCMARKSKVVHRDIMIAFVGPPPTDKHQVNHKNGKKRDNRLSNLEWVTPSENCRHAFATGLRSKSVANKRKSPGPTPRHDRWNHPEEVEWEMPLRPEDRK